MDNVVHSYWIGNWIGGFSRLANLEGEEKVKKLLAFAIAVIPQVSTQTFSSGNIVGNTDSFKVIQASDWKELGTVKDWPKECTHKRIYPTHCSSTMAFCGDGYYLDGKYYPPESCNTMTCGYTCDNYHFEMDSKSQ